MMDWSRTVTIAVTVVLARAAAFERAAAAALRTGCEGKCTSRPIRESWSGCDLLGCKSVNWLCVRKAMESNGLANANNQSNR